MKFTTLLGAATLALGCALAPAADFESNGLELNDLWVRASVPGQVNGAGYLQITNKTTHADRLLSVESDAATRIELHNVITENGVAQMRQVQGIDIPAGGSARLSPGGYHVMFLQLTAPFKQEGQVPVVLKFEKAGEVRVNFTVKPPTYNPSGQTDGADHSHGHDAGMKH